MGKRDKKTGKGRLDKVRATLTAGLPNGFD